MTTKSETTKKEVIRKAYGEHWDKLKDYIDENGWLTVNSYRHNGIDAMYRDTHDFKGGLEPYYIRPKSLQGIENNNGWFSIEEHGLPKKDGTYRIILKSGFKEYFGFMKEAANFIWRTEITHYKPIQEEKLPHY